MKNYKNIIGRNSNLFRDDINANKEILCEIIESSKFLILGGSGSIGQAVTKEIFKRNPIKIHVVDINENSLTELVRDIRSSFGYIKGEFKTFCIDIGSKEYLSFIEHDGNYDYVLNLSALKHVRSEKDPFTLMRMINVNILNTIKSIELSISNAASKYFCVSTDKAANPVNMMGASKRIMEMFLIKHSKSIPISTARFANVAFSDGSLMYGFDQRIAKHQPIVAPDDIKRYFITPEESGELCMMSCLLGKNSEIFFPKLSEKLQLTSFSDLAKKYLKELGYKPIVCNSEEEARKLTKQISRNKEWPCLFTKSDTTGEKGFEEFFIDGEELDLEKFISIGIVKNNLSFDEKLLINFNEKINNFVESKSWNKDSLVKIFEDILPHFSHKETGKYLDDKM